MKKHLEFSGLFNKSMCIFWIEYREIFSDAFIYFKKTKTQLIMFYNKKKNIF